MEGSKFNSKGGELKKKEITNRRRRKVFRCGNDKSFFIVIKFNALPEMIMTKKTNKKWEDDNKEKKSFRSLILFLGKILQITHTFFGKDISFFVATRLNILFVKVKKKLILFLSILNGIC